MADVERGIEGIENQMGHVVSTLDRLATNLDRLATNRVELDNALSTLTDAHIKTQRQFRETDARIDRLVLGIGEFIRAMADRKQ
jgi:predicted  nucleic acid-binding Zn-ribbon protein